MASLHLESNTFNEFASFLPEEFSLETKKKQFDFFNGVAQACDYRLNTNISWREPCFFVKESNPKVINTVKDCVKDERDSPLIVFDEVLIGKNKDRYWFSPKSKLKLITKLIKQRLSTKGIHNVENFISESGFLINYDDRAVIETLEEWENCPQHLRLLEQYEGWLTTTIEERNNTIKRLYENKEQSIKEHLEYQKDEDSSEEEIFDKMVKSRIGSDESDEQHIKMMIKREKQFYAKAYGVLSLINGKLEVTLIKLEKAKRPPSKYDIPHFVI